MNINNLLEELKDTLTQTPAKVHLRKTENGYQGDFFIDKSKYMIRFFDNSNVNPAKPKSTIEGLLVDYPDSYIVEFFFVEDENKSRFDVTGTGNVAKVFSTVLDTIKQVVNKEGTKAIFFEMPPEKNKQRLYKRFLGRVGEFIPGFSGERVTEKIYGMKKK